MIEIFQNPTNDCLRSTESVHTYCSTVIRWNSLDKQDNSKIVSQMKSLEGNHSFKLQINLSEMYLMTDIYCVGCLTFHMFSRDILLRTSVAIRAHNALFTLVKSAALKP